MQEPGRVNEEPLPLYHHYRSDMQFLKEGCSTQLAYLSGENAGTLERSYSISRAA